MTIFYSSSIFITLFVFFWVVKTWCSKEDWRIFSPFGVSMFCYLGYCGFGPSLIMMTKESDRLYGIIFSEHAATSAGMATASFISFFIAYTFFPHKKCQQVVVEPPINLNSTWKCGVTIYLFAWASLLVAHRFNIANMYNFLGGDLSKYSNLFSLGPFQNYIYLLGMSLQGSCVFLILTAFFQKRKTLFAYAFLANALLIVIATGFRNQIAFLLFSLANTFLLYFRRSPYWIIREKKWLLLRASWIIGALFLLLSLMSLGRSYGHGIDTNRLNGVSIGEIITAPFSETAAVYFCGGAVAEYVAKTGRYSELAPIKATLLMPIPRLIVGNWKDAEKAGAPTDLMEMNGAGDVGMAYLYFADLFFIGGWPVLIIGSALWGIFCRIIENLKLKKFGFIPSVTYILFSGYAFLYFHRGWMPQQATSLVFCVLVPITMMKILNFFHNYDLRRFRLTRRN